MKNVFSNIIPKKFKKGRDTTKRQKLSANEQTERSMKSSTKRNKLQGSKKGIKKPNQTDKTEKEQKSNSKEFSKEDKIDPQSLGSFVKKSLEIGPAGLKTEFDEMKRTNDFSVMKAFIEAQPHTKNRYKDVGCLDNNRVTLGQPWTSDYIHANYVATPGDPKRFICTQAPLENTCADFWFMCIQEKVEIILMLCNLMEKGTKKCHKYFPDKGETLNFTEGANTITVVGKSSKMVSMGSQTAKIKETVIAVEGVGQTSTVRHLHWIDWPDRCVPPPDRSIIRLLAKYRNTKNPIVVHCSAGIGRTGCLVMVEYMLVQLLSGQPIGDTKEILREIRKQRNNSIQTDHQYLFVHHVMLNYLNEKKLLDKNIDVHMKRFVEEYEKLVI